MFILIVVAIVSSYDLHQTPQEIEQEINERLLYFGSTVRLEHQQSEYFLHSHQVQYGSGSGQQSVTGMRADHDYNSLWTFKECWNTTLKKYDDQIKCGDCVRLEHMLTTKNLHSHFHQSPISGNQEVSAYGDNGNGDGADDWILECDGVSNDGQSQLSAKNWFQLKHKMTGKYLRASRKDIYNQRNCGYHCPIEGQLEISASLAKSPETRWKVYAGLFYLPIEKESDCNEYGDCDDIDSDDDEYRTVDL